MIHSITQAQQADDIASQIEARRSTLTVDEFAELLNVSDKTIYKAIDRGSLPAFHIGGAIRLDPKMTADWLRRQTTGLRVERKAA